MAKNELDKYSVRTDLALEANEMQLEQSQPREEIPGFESSEEVVKGCKITTVSLDENRGAEIGKKAGTYITIETDSIRDQDSLAQEDASEVFAEVVEGFLEELGISEEATCLIVGLGNWNITPDALGPIVCENILVTSHQFALGQPVTEGYRSVSALAPGVMGVTGIETSEIIKGVVEKTSPEFVLVVDALASRSIERVNSTIQISNTGIHPGSGVGNKRKELSEESLGVPVISIGVPTVVDAVSITSDTIDFLLKHLGNELKTAHLPRRALAPANNILKPTKQLTDEDLPNEDERESILGIIGNLTDEEKRQLIQEVLVPLGHNLMVTAKDVDVYIEDIANLISTGLNQALHNDLAQSSTSFKTH